MTKDSRTGSGNVTISGGTVNTGGGDIVGRDKIQYISSSQIDAIFDPVAKAVNEVALEQRPAAEKALQALKDEVGKGKQEDDSVLAKLIEGLVGLVPAAISGIVSAFAGPLLGSIAGPATKYVLGKIGHA
jgi:hypothetical protein